MNNLTVNLSCCSHSVLVKKSYFNKSTDHHKELEFLEKTNVFILELFLPTNYSSECKIHYDIFSDKTNHKITGMIKNNAPSKIITIVADSEEDEYFVSIKIMSPENTLIEACHQFVSKHRAEKFLADRQKKSAANTKYMEENADELEEIIEYTSFTRTYITPTNTSDLLGLFNAAQRVVGTTTAAAADEDDSEA